MFVCYERSVLTVQHPLCLSHAPGSIDLLIDKQEIIRNKVLKANSLCGSDTMDVSVRRQFKCKIFGFRINSGTFVGIYHSLHRAKRPPWTASPSPSPSPTQMLPDLLIRACFIIWGLDPFDGAQDKLVESFDFSAYLLSALRTSSSNIPCSIFDILLFSAIRPPSWSLPPVQASLFLYRVPPSSHIQHPALAHFRHFSSL